MVRYTKLHVIQTRFELAFTGKKTLILLISNSYAIVLEGGEEMDIEIAYIVAGTMIFVGAIVAGGIIYSGLEKIAKAIEKQK